jgi:UDP-N-acetylmuramoyl-tripeptide--D-alanyl-D-alanine ligase
VALRELALSVREKFDHPVFGITGSNGKTTTKEMLAAILGQKFHVLATAGNYNNLWGLPLTILQAREVHDFWLLEHGMNRPGEIAELCAISRPTAGLVTTINESHSENFDSLDGIARTKLAMYESLPEDGVTFQNIDDPLVAAFEPHTDQTVTYGMQKDADYQCNILATDDYSRVTIVINDGDAIPLQVSGEFQAINATASAAVGLYYGIPYSDIKSSLETFSGIAGRTKIIQRNGRTIIDDAYNANPVSMREALAILAEMPAKNRRLAILGDMLELDNTRVEKHRQIGEKAAQSNIDILVGVGPLAKELVNAASPIMNGEVFHFDDYKSCVTAIRQIVTDGDVILVKASHGIHLEHVVEAL